MSSEKDDKENVDKALELSLAHIRKEFGATSIQRLGDKPTTAWPAISTGAFNLDVALGIGGLPVGRVVEIYGPESSGKTTLALSIAAMCKGRVFMVDAEHALDPIYAGALGVDVDNLYISQPTTAEEGLGIADAVIKTGAFELVIIDSVAALTPKAEIEGDIGDSHMGLMARIMGQTLRKITSYASNTGTTVIFINQIREKIGVMFGSPETTPGGRALKFYSSVRLDIRKIEQIKDPSGEGPSGVRTRVKVVKNKMAPPFRQVEFDIDYGHGINEVGIVFDMAVEKGLIKRSGAWYSYGETSIGQGRPNSIQTLREDLDIVKELKAKLIELAQA